MFFHFPAKQQQGGIHIRHAGQVAGAHGFHKGGGHILGFQHHGLMRYAQFPVHQLDIAVIALRLKVTGGKITVVILIIHGEGCQLAAHFLHAPRRHSGKQAGIQPA